MLSELFCRVPLLRWAERVTFATLNNDPTSLERRFDLLTEVRGYHRGRSRFTVEGEQSFSWPLPCWGESEQSAAPWGQVECDRLQ
jgi:hypothetical protein